MFSKIDILLKSNLIEPEKVRGDHIATYGYIRYYKLIRPYMVLPLELFKLNPDRITWTEVPPQANLPHRDYGVSVNLNIYVKPGGAVTKFYNVNPGAIAYTPDPDRFYPNLYQPEDLELVGQFKAEPLEAYLLDVTQVHQVDGLEDTTRSMIQLTWTNVSYDRILSSIN